jgi:hypothetical protein
MSQYDMKAGQVTTVDFEGAFALYNVSKQIIEGSIQEVSLSIPCNGAKLTFERKLSTNGSMETVFSISKNNVTIPFVFATIQQQVKQNGQIVTQTIETGLGAFMKTIDGYLTGINADRHLDKLTEDFVAAQNNGNKPQNNGYQNNGGYKKSFNNNGYKKPYNNYNNQKYNNQNNNNNNNIPPWANNNQNMSSYQING